MRREQIQRLSVFYHVILRGDTPDPIFYTDKDRCRLCLLLQEWIDRYGHQIHGFCFMSTHIHLIVKTVDHLLLPTVAQLAFGYLKKQGRFKTIVVRNKVYLLDLLRYVHLNPVTAGVVTSPEQYLWSSHRAYLGLDLFSWLTREFILEIFTRPGTDPTARYENFITGGK